MILDPERHVPAPPAAQPSSRSIVRASDDDEEGVWQNPRHLIPDWLGML